MADSNITVKDAGGSVRIVDALTTPDNELRQVVVLGDGDAAGILSPATEQTLLDVLTALATLSTVALDAPTLAALESITATITGTVDIGDRTARVLGHVTPDTAGDVATTLTDGRKTVTTPGTAVALAASSSCKWVCVTALTNNTGQVNVGGSGTLATSGSSTGTPLAAGQSVSIPVSDPSKVFVDARVAGEGVSFTVGS